MSAGNPQKVLPALMEHLTDAVRHAPKWLKSSKDVVSGKQTLMSMETGAYEKGWKGWIGDLFSRSVWPFHLPVVIVVLVVAAIARNAG